jgi:hypothetical protein
MAFEGMPVLGSTFGLKSVTKLGDDEERSIGTEVGGEWRGTVVGVHFETKEGIVIRHHVVEVEKATIRG